MADSSPYLRATNQPTSDVRPSKTIFLVLPQPVVPAGLTAASPAIAPTAAVDTKDTMAAKAKMGWDMGRDMSHSPVRIIGLGYGGGYGPRGCNRRFCDAGPAPCHASPDRSRIIDYPRMTVGRPGGIAPCLFDSLDSLPDMIRLKRDFWRRVRGCAMVPTNVVVI